MAQQENELKYELTEGSFQELLALLKPEAEEPSRFCNCYFAAAEDTGRRDWVLRLRRGPSGPAELTLKVGRQTSPGTFCSTEYTASVASADPAEWEESEPIRVFRQEISKADIVAQGEARNERHLVQAPLGPVAQWEVDRTELPNGKVCYELEIEYPADVSPTAEQIAGFRAELEEWMFEQGLRVSVSTKSKYRRFLEAVGLHH